MCPMKAQQRGQELYRNQNYEAAVEAFTEVCFLSCTGRALPLTDIRPLNSSDVLQSAF